MPEEQDDAVLAQGGYRDGMGGFPFARAQVEVPDAGMAKIQKAK